MLLGMAVGTALVALTILVHYEALRLISRVLPRLTAVPPRPRIVFVIIAVFAAHMIEVYIYALGYWLLHAWGGGVDGVGLLHVSGQSADDLDTLIYFSAVSYTTLGFGDIAPLGGLRIVSGIEGLNGLLMIGWSASFTYLCMERLWPLHAERRGGHHPKSD